MTNIVTVNVQQQIAGKPPTLQGTGALISQGATNTTPGTKTLLTQPSSLTSILLGSKAVTSISQSAGVATVTTTVAHGFTTSDTIYITIGGSGIAAYNGTFLCTITGASTFTYAVPSGTTSPATGTIVYTVEDVAELLAMVTTFFAQGTNTGVYVLELGAGNPSDGVTFLTAWIIANPSVFYSYLVPRTWDANASFLAFLASFESTTAKTYFWVTTTLATYQNYTALMKDVLAMIEAPAYGVWSANVLSAISYSGGVVTATTAAAHGVAVGQWFQISGVTPAGYNGWWQALVGTTGSTLVYAVPAALGAESVLGTLVASFYASAAIPSAEFSQASAFWVALSYAPSPTNKVTPFPNSYLFGVTPFPVQANAALLTTLAAANISVVGTGAAGGISNALLSGGNTMDGNPFNYWYSADWNQINLQQNCTAAVINGANNPANPLYLDQNGINAIQAVAASTAGSAVTNGLALGTVIQTELNGTDFAARLAAGTYAGNYVINAVPFADYYRANPGDYAIGKYAGYTAVYTPQRGFTSIVFNLIITQFVAA